MEGWTCTENRTKENPMSGLVKQFGGSSRLLAAVSFVSDSVKWFLEIIFWIKEIILHFLGIQEDKEVRD